VSETVLWQRVECMCGRCAAIPEGGFFPLCGGCGRRMVAPPPDERVHYVSEGLSLDEAVRRHNEGQNGELHGPIPGHAPQYSHVALFKALRERKWPTDAQDWPKIPMPDGHSSRVPPWEVDA
jgi:hypothetical protein